MTHDKDGTQRRLQQEMERRFAAIEEEFQLKKGKRRKRAKRTRSIALFALVVIVAAAGSGVYFTKVRETETAAQRAAKSTSATGVASSNSESRFELNAASYKTGDCVTWNQDEDPGVRAVEVVPCEFAHLTQIAGKVSASQLPAYPEDRFRSFDATFCVPLVSSLIGAPLDPIGLFTYSSIFPTRKGWEAGDRDVWCAAVLQTFSINEDADLAKFVQDVRGADQTKLFGTANCFLSANEWTRIPCTEPHSLEIVGNFSLGSTITSVPEEDDQAGWDNLAAGTCQALAEKYAGNELQFAEFASALPFGPASYAAGRRVVECIVGNKDASKSFGSLKGVAV